MKKFLYLLVFVAIGAIAFFSIKQGREKKAENALEEDYEKIEKLQTSVEALAKDKRVLTIGDPMQWYVFDARLVDERSEEFFVKLKEMLGDDFDSQLSNGDYLFFGVFPYKQSCRIYAGNPEDEANMIYPDWNYEGVPAPDK